MSLGLHARHCYVPVLALITLLSLPLGIASAQTPSTLYTFSSGTQDWFRNFRLVSSIFNQSLRRDLEASEPI